MTVTQVIDTIRRTLNDEGDTERWTDAALIRYVSDAHQFLYQIRPDLFLDANGDVSVPSNLATLGASLTVGEAWRPFLQAYACSRALEEDSADTENMRRANEFMTLAMKTAVGVG